MLTEELRLDKIEMPGVEVGVINVRFVLVIMRDGLEISRQYIRRVVTHGDDLNGLPPRVQAIAHAMWDDLPPPVAAEDVGEIVSDARTDANVLDADS